MYNELVKRLRDAATMSETLAVLLPHSEGNATAKLYKEAADAIETLHAAYTESYSVIAKAFRNNSKDSVLREYMMKNACNVRPVKRGKWMLNENSSGTCSECGRTQKNCWDLDNWGNFCHFCEADMREKN